MNTSCLTLKKASPSQPNSIARRSSGRGTVFLGWEVFMYTYAGRNIQVDYKYSRMTARNSYGRCLAPHSPVCAFVLFAPGT